jgi:hypothetical protein
MCKYIVFIFHILLIISIFLAFLYPQLLIIHFLTIFSWYYYNGVCILTYLEDILFNDTVIDFYFRIIGRKRRENRRFVVPSFQRLMVFILFIFNLTIYLYNHRYIDF